MPDRQIISKPLCYGILISLTVLVFYPSLSFELLNWDDDWTITNNPLIRSLSVDNIIEIFSSTVIGNYQPITYFTFAIDHYFAGLNPFPYHLTNLILHVVNVLLVFVLMGRLMSFVSGDNSSLTQTLVPFVTALLFAVHPMRVEAVVWATERKELLYSFFGLASLLLYIQFIQAKTVKWLFYILSISMFILACLSKGLAVSLSLTLFLIDYLKMRKLNLKTILEKVPFLVIALLMGSLIYILLNRQGEIGQGDNLGIVPAIITASYGFTMYVYKLFIPLNLSAYYPYPEFITDGITAVGLMFPIVLTAGCALILYFKVRNRIWIFGGGFFLVFIVLVLQFVSVGNTIISERYTYLPYLGLFMIVAYSFSEFVGRENTSRVVRRIAYSVGIVIIAGLSILSYQRTYAWETSISLLTDIIEKQPGEFNIYFLRGSANSKNGDYLEAIDDYTKSIELNPLYYDSYNNRGVAYMELNQMELAIADFSTVLEKEPMDPKGHNNLGSVYFRQNKFDLALVQFDKTIEIAPTYVDAYLNRGNTYASLGSYTKALRDFELAMELDPGNSLVYFDRGNIAFARGNYKEANEYYNVSLRLNEGNSAVFMNRGKCYMMMNKSELGCQDWKTAASMGNEKATSLLKKHCVN